MPDTLLQTILSKLGINVPTAPEPDPLVQALHDQQARKIQSTYSQPVQIIDKAVENAPGFIKGFASGDVLPSKDQLAQDPSYGYGALAGAMLPFGEKAIPGMYSRLERLVGSLPSAINAGKLNNILNSGRVAKEELDWRKVPQFLQDYLPNKTVTRDALVEHLKANPLDVKTIQKGDDLVEAARNRGDYNDPTTIYNHYVMPGATNYRETLLQFPYPSIKNLGWEAYNKAISEPGYQTFQSGHWDEPNVLVHVRHNERKIPLDKLPEGYKVMEGSTEDFTPGAWVEGPFNGRQTYFGRSAPTAQQAEDRAKQDLGPLGRMIENIQSDWEQRGAHGGYGRSPINPETLNQISVEHFTQAQQDLEAHVNQLQDWLASKGVYPATGADNFDLPDRAGHLQSLLSTHADQLGHLSADQRAQELAQQRVTYDNAHDVMFRDIGDRVPDMPFKGMSGPPTLALKQQLLDIAHNAPQTQWIGIAPSSELRSRGEVISPEFQDKMLPSILEKLLKPYGGKIEQADLGVPVTSNEPLINTRITANEAAAQAFRTRRPTIQAPIARLTPEMLQQIKEKGFPLLTVLGMLGMQQAMPSHQPTQQ